MRLFFKALYILYYSTKTRNKSLYSMQCWARYFKKVISYITSYFSQIVTELLVTIVTLKKKSNVSNNLDVPNIKC